MITFPNPLVISLFQIFLITNLILFGNTESISKAESKFVQCGGTIQSDSGSLTFPEIGQSIIPGEVCVWTIHLDILEDFRLNFTSLAVSSDTTDCQSAGVRIYELTNLTPADNEEYYTFCDEEPPSPTFFLGQTIATVIFYTSADSVIDSKTGFTLNWEGVAYNPLKTRHLSSFSTTSSAAVQYPIIGGYESALAATWLIKADTLEDGLIDINLKTAEFETCLVADPCYCDALIIYEVSKRGKMTERRRFCGDVSSPVLLEQVTSSFLLAFFTDIEPQPGASGGFDLIYYPSQSVGTSTTWEPTTTEELEETTTEQLEDTTTEEPGETTTEEPEGTTTGIPDFSSTCGDILTARTGKISYKVNEVYGKYEQCLWTIRIDDPSSLFIKFKLLKHGFAYPTDRLILSTFRLPYDFANGTDDGVHEKFIMTEIGEVEMTGSVAIAVFVSDYLDEGTGFELEFEGISNSAPDVGLTSKSYVSYDLDGYLTHNYRNKEISTYAFLNEDPEIARVLSLKIKTGMDGLECCCYDHFRLYTFPDFTSGLPLAEKLCEYDVYPEFEYRTYSFVVLVFISDNSDYGTGFQIEWDWISTV